LGTFFSKRRQTNEAVKNLETALEQAKTVYHEKPHIILAQIRNELGVALMKDTRENSEKSLLYLQEAKEVMDQILGPNQPFNAYSFTSLILYNMGTNYYRRGNLVEAFQCFEDALNINSESCEENSIDDDTMGSLCSTFACTAEKLNNVSLAKEYFTKAVKIRKKMSLSKNRYRRDVVVNLYRLSWICEVLEEQDDALKHLEEAREVAKDAGFKHWIVVDVLGSLIKKYAETGCMIKSMMYYVEAGEIAMSLPEHGSLPPSILELLKLMKI
jgi:tetratricopeptide (TPR) repeat protein